MNEALELDNLFLAFSSETHRYLKRKKLLKASKFTENSLELNKSISSATCRIFSRVQPFYERAVSNLDKSMHRSLCV